jgi:hypothetical protein
MSGDDNKHVVAAFVERYQNQHDLAFADEIFHRGSHQLKGVPDPCRVLALVDGEFDISGPQPLPRDP